MNKNLRCILGIGVAAVFMSAAASAATIACAGVTNVVTQLGAGLDNCNVAPQTSVLFSNFSVQTSSGFTGAIIGIGSANVTGSEINLLFQIAGITPPGATSGDILLAYEVTGGIQGVDTSFQATPGTGGGSVTISEIACKVAFVGGVCMGEGNTLANFFATSTGGPAANSATFPTNSPVFIQKDVQFTNAVMSQFTNSQAVPEPMTLSMMGIGLLGLGLMRRRQAGKK